MRWLAALLLCLIPSVAFAQNPTCPTRPAGDSTNACASTTFVQQNPVVSLTAFGGKCDNTTLNDAPLSNALASLSGTGGSVYFPPGKCKFNSQVSFTLPAGEFSVSLFGSGVDATTLTWPNAAGGLQFNLSSQAHSIHIHDLSITTSQAGGGTAIGLLNSVGVVPFVIAGSQTTINNIFIGGEDRTGLTNYWTIGINDSQVSNINIDSATIYGNSAGTLGTGFAVDGSTAFQIGTNIQRSNFFSLGTGISVGTRVQGLTVNSSSFVNGTTGINVLAAGTGLEQLYVGGSEFNVLGDQIITTTAFPDATFTANTFFVPSGKSGLNLAANQVFNAVGNYFQGITAGVGTGVTVGTSGGVASNISGNIFQNLSGGINLQAGSQNVSVNGNDFSSTTTPIVNSGTNNSGIDLAWATFTPSPSCGTATFTVNSAKSRTLGKTTWIITDISFTALGTCTNGQGPNFSFTLPNVPNTTTVITGREVVNNSGMTSCTLASGTSAVSSCVKQVAALINWTGTDRMIVSGVYENQ
jgi:hypothetical protein